MTNSIVPWILELVALWISVERVSTIESSIWEVDAGTGGLDASAGVLLIVSVFFIVIFGVVFSIFSGVFIFVFLIFSGVGVGFGVIIFSTGFEGVELADDDSGWGDIIVGALLADVAPVQSTVCWGIITITVEAGETFIEGRALTNSIVPWVLELVALWISVESVSTFEGSSWEVDAGTRGLDASACIF